MLTCSVPSLCDDELQRDDGSDVRRSNTRFEHKRQIVGVLDGSGVRRPSPPLTLVLERVSTIPNAS